MPEPCLQRVVVTGAGVISPLGNNLPDFWRNLLAGENGISTITRFDTTGFPTRIAGQVKDFDVHAWIEHKEARRMAPFTQFAVGAALEALQRAGLKIDAGNADQIGVSLGCGIGGMQVIEDQHRILLEKGPHRVSPLLIPMFIPNMAAGQVAIQTGARGPNNCPVTACASASHAIGDAFRILQRGDAQAMITGGTEAAITPLSMAGFASAKTMSTRNDDPEHASRPFDRQRDGFVMGEGSGILILETLSHAQARGAEILAEVAGFGMTGDAYHITAPSPDGEGLVRAIQIALKDAALSPFEIDYINAHGTSTPLNDITETKAIHQVFAEAASQLVVSSTKSMTGHLLGAAGGIEAIASVMSLREQIVHPTRNFEESDPECDLDYVPGQARKMQVRAVLSNNMGFGGHNACLVFKRFEA
ncbi:beta-ketoacyl-[acyl-carrier-protein] synthase II [bacterium (Candidatus Blackallbacteria) CG17_big_fil_post_rev_8_21_14_2_50_48_46]|uniref:3-oxoacyl-[acyl-carrier-protein] synthase 2 n=1 Tax=bacterium (Candidatus Blackallbacteria) CG17_big_fil_post_rev_8_21_14_2_50_48_46 TaxID=2014261 RepID=A0A2M7G160_9BACT|nr:MAG: beta-ketoacyl-[acyl-carrier-protein] synthase II [bacterium (Candidatus Blackallbacteria) CG18_big_fil_WC_8_21_14_2_50_49_26]PIW15419.1 MAG: beta-ketoacyl-[acyl-carrier-protein] synthase II [bacterium (Candidatus Blackallbacteria) CG17_big_fil_post_rev_8_21_14_2_50_48_46]PIW49720.1 MAG: beta-ketoacyl-[acyl-carrier-protein] synthase II [bacterium (Candidatus Blackallbacteria) CG13_big_fil_rev_8_21_14_2_50_49_14]